MYIIAIILIQILNNMSSFIISDLHFGHENLCRNLRGMSAEENDALLIQR